jgi:hypothetical protein
MTIGEIVGTVRINIGDEDQVSFSDSDILEAIDDVSKVAGLFSGCYKKKVRLNYDPAVPYYDLSALIPDYFTVLSVYDDVNKRFLETSTLAKIEKEDGLFETTVYTPYKYAVVDLKRIFLGRVPYTSEDTFLVNYVAYPPAPDVANADIFEYVSPAVMEFGATAELLMQLQEFTLAQDFGLNFNAALELITTSALRKQLATGGYYAG